MRKYISTIAFTSLALAAPIQTAAAQSVGMQVVDTSGGLVGTVTALNGQTVTVKTDKHEVAMPRASFTLDKGKLLFAMTQAQLNAEIDKTQAAAAAAVVPGTTVKGSAGTVVGTIDAVDTETITVKLQSGSLLRVPRSGIAAGNGEVTVGLTAAEIQAQASPAAN